MLRVFACRWQSSIGRGANTEGQTQSGNTLAIDDSVHHQELPRYIHIHILEEVTQIFLGGLVIDVTDVNSFFDNWLGGGKFSFRHDGNLVF